MKYGLRSSETLCILSLKHINFVFERIYLSTLNNVCFACNLDRRVPVITTDRCIAYEIYVNRASKGGCSHPV
jgi:hypothetical protein